MKTTIWALLLVASTSVCYGADLSPQTPVQKTAATSKNAKPEQRGTQEFPVVVEIKSTPQPTQEEKDREAAEKQEKVGTDRSLVKLTGLLAGFTFVLAVCTGGLWWVTRQLAIDTANSAKKTVAAMQAAEQAYLFHKFPKPQPTEKFFASNRVSCNLKIKNLGKTPAEIVQLRGYIVIEPRAPESLMSFDGSDRRIPAGTIALAYGIMYGHPINRLITENDRLEIEAGRKRLFVVGRVLYKDMFGQERETGFCRYLQIFGGEASFIPDFSSPLNRRT